MARKSKPSFASLEQEYSDLYNSMKIKRSWTGGVANVSTQIKHHKHRYQTISDMAGGSIPWQFIGVIHNLECGLSFAKHLHNGDSLRRKTRRVPAGRPRKGLPPYTFEESAVDALRMKGFHKITDWSPARMCYELEKYNGFGYRQYHSSVLSPYLWSGTTHYRSGKYIADGKWSSSAVSKQMGAIPVLKYLEAQEKPQKVSRKHKVFSRLNKVIPAGGIGLGTLWSTLENVRTFMTDNAGLIVLGLGAMAVLVYLYIQSIANDDLAKGNYVPSGLIAEDDDSDE